MKKILLAFDGTQFSEGAFAFVRRLNEYAPVLLTGVFMPQVSYASLWSYAPADTGSIPMAEPDDAAVIRRNREHFEQLCRLEGIPYRIHKDYFDFALPALKKETRFADLLILGAEKFYQNVGSENALNYLTDALKETECPVVIVPEIFSFPERNVLAYDGSASSVFAIKQFSYLLPELCRNETTLLHMAEGEEGIPDEQNIRELLSQHFQEGSLHNASMGSEEDVAQWASENTNSLLVAGSFGRSSLSQFFRKSFVHNLLATHKLPLFIAHR